MAKVPPIRRLLIEDFPSEKSWIGKLFEILNSFIITTVNGLTSQLTIRENMLAQIDVVRVRTNNGYTAGDASPTLIFASFVDGDVNPGTDEITLTGHPFSTGEMSRLTTTGVLPAGLSLDTNYWIIKIGANTIQLASSLANAFAGTPVNITAAAGGGTHTLTEWIEAPAYVGLFEAGKYSVKFKASPVFVVLGGCFEVSNNQVINRQATTADWSYENGIVTINAVSGLKPSKQYDLILYTSGG